MSQGGTEGQLGQKEGVDGIVHISTTFKLDPQAIYHHVIIALNLC